MGLRIGDWGLGIGDWGTKSSNFFFNSFLSLSAIRISSIFWINLLYFEIIRL
jgi:hypothetical protein